MGVYDIYREKDSEFNVQIKVGEVCLNQFLVGDEVSIPDGIYFGNEGAVVIYKGKFAAIISPNQIFDKWGYPLTVSLKG